MLTRAALAVSLLLIVTVPAQRPDIVLITLDTTRADRMGFLGSARGLTPSLDAFARQATVFTRAYAQAPITTVSHATILTGTFPPFHRVTDLGSPLAATVPYVPALVHAAGYRTGAFVGAVILEPHTAPGFERGFDVYDAPFRARRAGENRYAASERRGDAVLANAMAWLRVADSRPRFLWIHLFDPHDPYEPPGAFRQRFSAAPYDGEIAWTDDVVGRLFKALADNGTLDRSVVVIAADHGEALGDHGEATHGLFLYDETIHVPLVIRVPGARAGRVDARVQLADIAPTILEAAALTVPASMQGHSLLRDFVLNPAAAANGSPRDDRPVYAETDYPRRAFGWSPLAAWRADRFLFVRAPRRELYDQTADPSAGHDLSASRSRVADAMDRELTAFLARTTGAPGAAADTKVDADLAARLASLGYVSGSPAPKGAALFDPKDGVSTANALHDAISAAEDGDFGRAIPLLERVVAHQPSIPYAQLQLGLAHQRLGHHQRALSPLRQAVRLQPENAFARYALGVSCVETGNLAAAAAEFEAVVAGTPGWADARYSLAAVDVRLGRVTEAIPQLRAALAAEPRHFRANLLLGRVLLDTNQAAAAIGPLRTAIDSDPASAEAHELLAGAYTKTGDVRAAGDEHKRAEKLRSRPNP